MITNQNYDVEINYIKMQIVQKVKKTKSRQYSTSEETLSTLNEFAAEEGDLVFDNNEQNSEERVGRMMQLVVACPEYQFA